MSELGDESIDTGRLVEAAASGLVGAMGTDRFGRELVARIDELPVDLMMGFDGTRDGSDEARAEYLGTHLRRVLDTVEEQSPDSLNDHYLVERVVSRYDEIYGVQPWVWVKTVVERALPSEYERLYEPTLGRIAMGSSKVRRGDPPPVLTPWAIAMAPGIAHRGPLGHLRDQTESAATNRRAFEFYHQVTGRSPHV